MKTIVVTAYAINPYKGSEDATGWNWVVQMAKHNKIIAITRENNQPAIDKFFEENPKNKNLTFQYFDLPYWARFWKKGEYAALVYYYLWQLFIPFFILKRKFVYDYLHHLNFHNDWTPSFLWFLNKPFIWGPIGHHPKILKEYYNPDFPKRYYRNNKMRWWIKQFFWKLDPFLKITKYTATHILVMHDSVAKKLNLKPHKYSVVPAIASNAPNVAFEVAPKPFFNAICIGRFIPLKAFDITINAFAHFYKELSESDKQKAKLTIVGKGKLKNELHHLAKKHQIGNAIEFIDWIEKSEVENLYKNASCLFFPSHEGAGMVVMEALSFGLPILCFDNIGPGAFINARSGTKIEYSNYNKSVVQFASILKLWFTNKELLQEKSLAARKLFLDKYQWKSKAEAINEVISKIENNHAESSMYPSLQ